ncbi:unnamed protein product, partial [Polarella glacialis]
CKGQGLSWRFSSSRAVGSDALAKAPCWAAWPWISPVCHRRGIGAGAFQVRNLCRSSKDLASQDSGSGSDAHAETSTELPARRRPHPMSLRFAYSQRPFFPIWTRNLRDFSKRKKGKRMGKGMAGDGGITWRSKRQIGKKARTYERGTYPLFKRVPRWPEAHMRNKRKTLEPLNLSKLRYFIQKGRLDTRFPITQRHLFDS